MRGGRRNASFLICVLFILSIHSLLINEHFESNNEIDAFRGEYPTEVSINSTEYWSQACSSVIVTGNASKDGRAILMKNRDLFYERANRPVFVPRTSNTFAFVGVNTNAMGINEKGLAVMNTYLPALAGSDPVEGNLILNQKILERYDSVVDVAHALNDSCSLIGPVYRSSSGDVATCIGVIDRFGVGAFFEISNTRAYVQYVVDGYDTRANHPRIFPPYISGPNGRDQYLLDALDEVYEENGFISWEHIMQNVSRYVHHKELGSVDFTIDGEACNPNTVATMVAVSGDSRYDGQLNCMWTACGPNPLVGVFVPSMVCAESTPDSITDLWVHTYMKYRSAQVQTHPLDPILLDPDRVREVQEYAFFAENYTISEYDRLMSSVPEGLSEDLLKNTIRDFIESMGNFTSEIFIEETIEVSCPPSVTFPTPITTSTPTQSTTLPTSPSPTTSTTTDPTSPISTLSDSLLDNEIFALTVGAFSGFTLVMVAAVIKRRFS